MSSGHCKVKWQCDTITHLSECQNPEQWQQQTLGKMWINRNSHLLLMGMQNGTVILKDRQFLIKLSILLPYKAHCLAFTQSSWKGVSTQEPTQRCLRQFYSYLPKQSRWLLQTGEWIHELVHSNNGILVTAKKKWATKPKRHRGILNTYYWERGANLKSYIPFDSEYMTSGKGKTTSRQDETRVMMLVIFFSSLKLIVKIQK